MCNTKPLEMAFLWMVILAMVLLIPCVCLGSEDQQVSGYRLGAGDVVKISVLAGGQEQLAKDMVVSESGYVTVPFIGKMPAAGMTLIDLEKQIQPPLARDYFVNPQIHLQMKEYHSLQFFISGAVSSPGMYSLDFIPTLMDLIAKAGGVTGERGNVVYILRGIKDPGLVTVDTTLSETEFSQTIVDARTKPIVVNLRGLLDEGDMTENIRLQSGDTIYIPPGARLDQSDTTIFVQGKVRSPGMFDYRPGLTALAACIMAGGFDSFAAPNRARIIRHVDGETQIITINLKKVQTGDAQDMPLQPGDHIHIPESWL